MSEMLYGDGTCTPGDGERKEIVVPENSLPALCAQMGKLLDVMNGMSRKISELERQLRIDMPLSRTMELNVLAAIRTKAKALAGEYAPDDPKAFMAIGREIRAKLYQHYGVRDIRSMPRCDYEIILERVGATRWTTRMTDLVRPRGGPKGGAAP